MNQDKIEFRGGGMTDESKTPRRFDSRLSATSLSFSPKPSLCNRSKTAAIFSLVTGDLYWAVSQVENFTGDRSPLLQPQQRVKGRLVTEYLISLEVEDIRG